MCSVMCSLSSVRPVEKTVSKWSVRGRCVVLVSLYCKNPLPTALDFEVVYISCRKNCLYMPKIQKQQFTS